MDNMSAPPESTGVEKKWSEKAETVWQELIRWKHKPRKRENVTELLTQIANTLQNIKKEDTNPDDYCDLWPEGNLNIHDKLDYRVRHEKDSSVRILPNPGGYVKKSSCVIDAVSVNQQQGSMSIDQQTSLITESSVLSGHRPEHDTLSETNTKKRHFLEEGTTTLSQEENLGSQPLFSQLTDELTCSLQGCTKYQLDMNVSSSPPLDLSPDSESFNILSQKYPSMKSMKISEKSWSGCDSLLRDTNHGLRQGKKNLSIKSLHTETSLNNEPGNINEIETSKSIRNRDSFDRENVSMATASASCSLDAASENHDHIICSRSTDLNHKTVSSLNNQKNGAHWNAGVLQEQQPDIANKGKILPKLTQQQFTISGRLKTLKTLMKQSNNSKPMKRKVKSVDSKTSFAAPFKKNNPSCKEQANWSVPHSSHKASVRCMMRYDIQYVANMSELDKNELKQRLSLTEEMALTLMYQDGTSQLREDIKQVEPVSIIIAYPDETSKNDHKLKFVSFPLTTEDKELKDFSCIMIGDIMQSKARKLCFEGQEIIKALITSLQFMEEKVCTVWRVFDVKVAGWLLNPDNPPVTFKQVLMPCQELQQESFPDSEDDVCSDLSLLGPVMSQSYNRLKEQELWELFTDIETPLLPILAVMETRSVLVNTNEMTKTCNLLKKRLSQLEKEAHTLAGQPFNINSHPQLRQMLFEVLHLDIHLPKTSKSRTKQLGNQSTSEAVLSQLADVHPLPKVVLEYRQLQKMKSTYVDGMMAYVVDNKLHTHWDQVAAATGRLTSTNPNIQAIPKMPIEVQGGDHCIVGKETIPTQIFARAPFISKEDWSFLAVDFRQIELRILAHLSQDETLLKIFNSKSSGDIFIELASLWHGKLGSEVSTQDREQAKRVVYAVMYGAGKDRLAQYLKVHPEDAKAIMQSFLSKFPGISSYTKSCISTAKAQRYQTTIFKRRRFLPKITDTRQHLQAQAERQAINFSVQGSAADLCKAAMLQVEHCLQHKPHLHAKLLFQIHDELLLEVPDEEIQETAELVRGIMEDRENLCGRVCDLSVPLEVSLSVGKSWGHLKEYRIGNQ